MNETDGVWRTVCGRRVFIKTGQSLSDALRESGKYNTKQIKNAKKIDGLFAKKKELEQKHAELEIKEDLATPIEKNNNKEEKKEFNPNDYAKISVEEFNELAHQQQITKEQHDILYDVNSGYISTDSGAGINNSLREKNLEINFAQRKTRDTLQQVISKNKLKNNIIATRYIDQDYLEQEFGITISRNKEHSEFLNAEAKVNQNKDKIITNKGFMSVSATEESVFKERAVKLNTYISIGTNAFVTENIEESEIILNTNTKYRIIKAYNVTDDYGYDQLNIDVEVLK